MRDTIADWLGAQGLPPELTTFLAYLLAGGGLLLLALLAGSLARRSVVPLLEKAVRRSNATWDDSLASHRFFIRMSRLVPFLVVYVAIDLVLPAEAAGGEFIKRLAMVGLMIGGVRVLDSLLMAVRDILAASEVWKGRPLRGYAQAVMIIAWVLAAIAVVSILTGRSPWGIISVLGGLTAVLILVFKDTILGFVASLQLSANDIVRVGDWIEIPKYGADGDVIDVTIHTVKVRNWDKTIVNVPTYALVSDSLKNWRGMQESGGRRIKRSLFIDMQSISFCTPEMLERFGSIAPIADYVRQRQTEIERANAEQHIDLGQPVNGRRQTNIGVFRAYVTAYLRAHPKIHQEMTFLVRHLQPTAQGLPLEIYVFSRDQVWANYESIQADIFDHILAALPHFDLRIFQYPSGHDLKSLTAAPPPAAGAAAMHTA